MLRRLPELAARFGLPLLVSVSRKAFLRKPVDRPAAESGAASLAAELFAQAQGADYIRTHAPGALADGLESAENPGKAVLTSGNEFVVEYAEATAPQDR